MSGVLAIEDVFVGEMRIPDAQVYLVYEEEGILDDVIHFPSCFCVILSSLISMVL